MPFQDYFEDFQLHSSTIPPFECNSLNLFVVFRDLHLIADSKILILRDFLQFQPFNLLHLPFHFLNLIFRSQVFSIHSLTPHEIRKVTIVN